MANSINVKAVKGNGTAPKDAISMKIYGDIGGGSGGNSAEDDVVPLRITVVKKQIVTRVEPALPPIS